MVGALAGARPIIECIDYKWKYYSLDKFGRPFHNASRQGRAHANRMNRPGSAGWKTAIASVALGADRGAQTMLPSHASPSA
jgi:hypothetical protein